ncbi:nucleotidyltransferase domain-containing protein [Cyanobacterium sp. IPPAS B-1200]|uniref:nucleotidyltransferase domain-containing protein n=1 Tax=Cyanobacterium sp. IPPAS B-1200 TaxID=1562720 RepID=UPI0008525B77|nr:nucleotidyltransferase domain-containing protein [Cyanobacterium sp. IPPAS B-1200]OEJ77302.1 nucleotidyltransferase [Cyanobacterium sp. IPPAS B-1200]
MKHPELDKIINKTKKKLSECYKKDLHSIILYGSQARGDAKIYSDIDILIVLKSTFNYLQELNKTSTFIADLSLEYDTVISRAFISQKSFLNDKTPFLINIKREGIPL